MLNLSSDQCSQNSNPPLLATPFQTIHYINEGYSITRTEAPKDFVGSGEVNLARTTPELPIGSVSKSSLSAENREIGRAGRRSYRVVG